MEEVPTVLDRMTRAGISQDSIEAHLKAGTIRLGGEPVVDLASPAPPPARIVIAGSD